MKPLLIIEATEGVRRVRVEHDPGDEVAAFDILRKSLASIRRLDRALRRGPAGR